MYQPIPNPADCDFRLLLVVADVLPVQVGDELHVPIALFVENQAVLLLMPAIPVGAAPNVKTELVRHVKAGEFRRGIQLDVGEVMNAVVALSDQVYDLVDPNHRRVVMLERTAGDKPDLKNTKNDRLKYRLETWVEGTIDENTVTWSRSWGDPSQARPPASRSSSATTSSTTLRSSR